MTKPDPTPKLTARTKAEPDLVDRIFDYILAELPEVAASVAKHKAAVRAEFKGEDCYIAFRPATVRQQIVKNIRAQFNGVSANAESVKNVAKAAGVSRSTVYRVLKQTNGQPR